jgi:hypothetical protein
MARRCTTVPGFGKCCLAAQQGLLGRAFKFNDSRGNTRCGECTTRPSRSRDPRKAGRTVFEFRFHKNAECGIGPGGCPYLTGAGAGQTTLALPPPGPGGVGGFLGGAGGF